MHRSIASYLQRHWRGELSLAVSYWINGTALGLLILMLAGAIGAVLSYGSLYTSAVLGVVLILLSLTYWIWSIVGIWRAAGQHTQRGGSAVWAVTAQIMVVFGAFSMTTALVTQILPALREYMLIVTGNDPMGRVQLQLSHDGTVLILSGGLGQGAATAVRKQLQAAPDVVTVMLDSHGGRLREAEQIASLIRQYDLDTYVEGQCASACTYVFLAGNDRAATPNAQIGFHRPTFPGFSAEDELRAMQDMRRVYLNAGISGTFADRVAQTSPQEIWYPTHEELLENAVINRTSLGGELATLSSRTETSFADIERALREESLFVAIDQRFPGALDHVLEATRQAYEQQLPDHEVWTAARSVVGSYVPELLGGATDELLESFLELVLAQLQALDGLSDAACGLYLQARLDAGKTMPPAVIAQEAHWVLRALKTAPRTDGIVDPDQAHRALRLAMAEIAPEHLVLITGFEQNGEHSPSQCQAMAELYRRVQVLPISERRLALRGLFQSPAE